MSTQNERLGQTDTCQFYCKQQTAGPESLCPGAGTGGGPLSTTDGSQQGSLLRFCWLKQAAQMGRQQQQQQQQQQQHYNRAAAGGRQGPWINLDL